MLDETALKSAKDYTDALDYLDRESDVHGPRVQTVASLASAEDGRIQVYRLVYGSVLGYIREI